MSFTHQNSPANTADLTVLPPPPLPADSGIISRFVDTEPYGLVFHILESLPQAPAKGKTKLILLVHGFPDLAYSWRKVLPSLASHGYHAVAYDTRGFGRTFSRKPLSAESFRPINLMRDAIALVSALGYESVSAIVGHDFGSVTATLCALARPDIFRALVLMSHPVRGPAMIPISTSVSYGDSSLSSTRKPANIHLALATLPVPRKHYQRYFSTDSANDEMAFPTGTPLHNFLRGYFHLKSADWHGNVPHRLTAWSATELAKMPGYYIMNLDENMRQTVARDMALEDMGDVQKRGSRWLRDEELAYYVDEWSRTGFQGGLNWYRLVTEPHLVADMCVWRGSKLSVPTTFISGQQDWGSYQDPGALELLESGEFVDTGMYRGTKIVDGAGHWLNQEQPHACVSEILKIAREVDNSKSLP